MLIAQKKELQEKGADPLEIQTISEELISINSSLRRLTAGRRIGRGAIHDDMSADHQQYKNWTQTTWSDMEEAEFTWKDVEATTSQLRNIVNDAEQILSPTKLRYFNEWSNGATMQEIADKYGVYESTVSRSIRDAKNQMKEAARVARFATDKGALLDLSEVAAAKLLLSVCTPKQVISLYLYYGEWLSTCEVARLLDLNKTTTLMHIHRGLEAISEACHKNYIILDNMDALGEMAFMLYRESDYSTETEDDKVFMFGAAHSDWGRRKLGMQTAREPRPEKKPEKEIFVEARTAGMTQIGTHRYENRAAPQGNLMKSLLAKARDGARRYSIRQWLESVFCKLRDKLLS